MEDIQIVNSAKVSVGRLTIHNSTHLQYQQISTETGAEIDNFWIIKEQPIPLGASLSLIIVGVVFLFITLAVLVYNYRRTKHKKAGIDKLM